MDLTEDTAESQADNKEEVVTHLQNMLGSILKMDEDNKNKAFKYIQNITKLSEMYQLTN